jgi:hypothetical protein
MLLSLFLFFSVLVDCSGEPVGLVGILLAYLGILSAIELVRWSIDCLYLWKGHLNSPNRLVRLPRAELKFNWLDCGESSFFLDSFQRVFAGWPIRGQPPTLIYFYGEL